MDIGTRFRQLRTHFKLSGEKVGAICGVTKGMVSQWESNISSPPTERLLALREKYPFSLDWLLTGDGEMISSGLYVTNPRIAAIATMLQNEGAPYLVEKIQKDIAADIELMHAAARANDS